MDDFAPFGGLAVLVGEDGILGDIGLESWGAVRDPRGDAGVLGSCGPGVLVRTEAKNGAVLEVGPIFRMF